MTEPGAAQGVGPQIEDLGNQVEQFSSHSDTLRALMPAGMVLSGLLCIFFFYRMGGDRSWMMLISGALGLFGIAYGISLIFQNQREGHWQVLAFEKGMLLTYGSEKKVLRWSDILYLKQDTKFTFSLGDWQDSNEGIPICAYQVYTIQTQNGDQYTFSGVEVEALGKLLRKKVQPGQPRPGLP